MPSNDQPYLGVDLGGTSIKTAILGSDGIEILGRGKKKTKADEGPETVVERIVKAVNDALDEADVKRKQISGVGIGAPGAVDINEGVVLNAPNLRWTHFPLAKELSDKLELPVVVDNDVNVGTWGEYVNGAGKGFDHVLGIFVGTGIGAGLVIDRQLYHGHFCTAGEIGHTIIRADAPLGQRTLENLASRTAIAHQLRQLIEANHPSDLPEHASGDLDSLRAKPLAAAFQAGDKLTTRVIEQAAKYAAVAIANTVTLLSLPCVVIGGGLTTALGEPWVNLVRQSFDDFVFPAELRQCKLVLSELGDDAGPIGAAALARHRLMK